MKDGSGNAAAVTSGTTTGVPTPCTVNTADVTVSGTAYNPATAVTVRSV
ncbi:MAG: hypothetical protein ACTHJH_04045 [Marmoricola sp.]